MELRGLKREAQLEGEAFLYKVVDGQVVLGQVKDWKPFFEDVPQAEVRGHNLRIAIQRLMVLCFDRGHWYSTTPLQYPHYRAGRFETFSTTSPTTKMSKASESSVFEEARAVRPFSTRSTSRRRPRAVLLA